MKSKKKKVLGILNCSLLRSILGGFIAFLIILKDGFEKKWLGNLGLIRYA